MRDGVCPNGALAARTRHAAWGVGGRPGKLGPMTAQEWLAAFAGELGTSPPDDATVETLLNVAGVAAHASERTAAPIACWLLGRAGLDPQAALDLARRVADLPGQQN